MLRDSECLSSDHIWTNDLKGTVFPMIALIRHIILRVSEACPSFMSAMKLVGLSS